MDNNIPTDPSEFERYVARLYVAMGYNTTESISQVGQQVDLLADKYFSGLGRVCLAIECKSHAARVGNQLVHDFISTVDTLRAHNLINGGVMVARSGFTANALDAAFRLPYVELLTPEDLYQSVLDSDHALLPLRRTPETESRSPLANGGRNTRALSSVFAISSTHCDVILPSRIFKFNDIHALTHLVSACMQLPVEPHPMSSGNLLVEHRTDRIVVGGWKHNCHTLYYLKTCCQGFETKDGDPETWRGTTQYQCGGAPLSDSRLVARGYLAKLTGDVPEFPARYGTVHLCWGHRGTGTAAAAYFLTHHYEALLEKFQDGPYFVVLDIPVKLGYQAVSTTFEDFTAEAFETK